MTSQIRQAAIRFRLTSNTIDLDAPERCQSVRFVPAKKGSRGKLVARQCRMNAGVAIAGAPLCTYHYGSAMQYGGIYLTDDRRLEVEYTNEPERPDSTDDRHGPGVS